MTDTQENVTPTDRRSTRQNELMPGVVPSLPTGKSHVSFSEVKDWYDCTFRHRLRYVKKIGEFIPGPALTFGTACHAACEDFLKTRTMKPEIATQIIEKDWANFSVKFPTAGFTNEMLIVAKNDAAAVLCEVPAFMDSTFKNWKYISAEEYLFEPIVGHDDVKFKGFIDCIIECDGKRKNERVTWIIDFKTSGRGWFREKRSDFITQAQLVLYKNYWAIREAAPMKNIRCGFVLLKRQAKQNEHIELFAISVGPVTLGKSLKVINNAVTGIKRGLSIKNRNSCKYCDYYQTQHCP